MATEKNLLTSKRFFGAQSIDSFVQVELTSEKSMLRPDKADNVVDLSQKFEEERKLCGKFCVFGLVQSKWSDCSALKIDFYISDNSKNVSPSNQRELLWVYDKSTKITATTYSIQSRPLDNVGGKLSLNMYQRIKGSYFFPFEIDINTFSKNQDGIVTNKSLYIEISQPLRNSYLKKEIPLIYFDEDGVVIDYGQETADVLPNGDVIEINNNYPYLYDRHWIREELNPEGPPYVSFVTDTLLITEGGTNDRARQDKLIPIEVALSTPSKSGLERVKIDVLYGLDENKRPYTTTIVPADVILQQNYLKWDYPGEDPLKFIYLKLNDDFIVEPTERITLKMTPLYGCLADLEKPQILSIYITDNDIPSNVSFENNNFDFQEPRENQFEVPIKIAFELDKTVLIDQQFFDVYIDRTESTSKATYGFASTTNISGYTDTERINVNMTDTKYSTVLYYKPTGLHDLDRNIVLRMSGFTTNLRPAPPKQNTTENKLTIKTKQPQFDKNFATINIPYIPSAGKAIIRNVYNVPDNDYYKFGQRLGTNLTTEMAYFNEASSGGFIQPNSAVNSTSASTNSNSATKNIKSMVVEQEFQISITNRGLTPVILDYSLYQPNETCVIVFKSGYTFSSTNRDLLVYDGEKFVLKLPANGRIRRSPPDPVFPYSANSSQNYYTQYNNSIREGTFTYTASTFGYKRCVYDIFISNNSYNYVILSPDQMTPDNKNGFYATNLVTQKIFHRMRNGSAGSAISYDELGIYATGLVEGNESSPINYYASTLLKNVKTRDVSNISTRTGTTLTKISNEYFYDGVALLPSASTSSDSTISKVFLSTDKAVDTSTFLTMSSSTQYSALLPTTNIILQPPLSAHTLYCQLNFGEMLVQNGYGSNNEYDTNFWGQSYTTGTYDSFVLAYNIGDPAGRWSNRTLSKWSWVYWDTYNNAVIEIVNTGIIEAYFPNGIVAKPGERVVISQNPVTPTNGTAGFYNIVRPIAPLSINLSTNNNYDYNLEKFKNCSYKISFLNFRLWNKPNPYSANWTNTNKTVNYSINMNDDVTETIGGQLVAPPRYLITKYSRDVYVDTNSNFWGNKSPNCGNYWQYYNLERLTRVDKDAKLYLHGIVITASSSSPVEAAAFFKERDNPGNRGSDYRWCGNNPWGPDCWIYYDS